VSKAPPRILYVAFSHSIHTVRWVNQLSDLSWEVHLFPSEIKTSVHPAFRNVIIHNISRNSRERAGNPDNPAVAGVAKLKNRLRNSSGFLFGDILRIFDFLRQKWVWSLWLKERVERLTGLIREVKPQIIHSLELQHAGYLTLKAKEDLGENFPPWVVTNWGADIHYFGKMPEQAARIKAILASCDYYSCETKRDIQLARDFGFKGEILPVLPNTGGFDLQNIHFFRQQGPTSDRRVILLKGPNAWVYRGLVGVRALAHCSDVLAGYKIAIYLAAPEVRDAAIALSKQTGIPVELIPYCSHEEMLRWHGRARISIGLAMSDGISTSFLEAIVMGSFPIQSNTGGAGDWIVDGQTGILVPPEDMETIAKAIRRALTDDELVNRAAVTNEKTARERLDYEHVRSQVIAMYKTVLQHTV
jgi:glycosyltransferase involved in cell wall biosynthesis